MGTIIRREIVHEFVKKAWRNGQKVVLTNGCFDVLHRGHFETMKMAAKQGSCLIVGVNTDESIRVLKGPHRPVYKLEDRMFMVSQITGVDYVVPFGTAEDPSVEPLVELIRPDVLVKGGDYSPDGVVGAAVVQRYGGRVVIAPKVEGASTTETISKLTIDDPGTNEPRMGIRPEDQLAGICKARAADCERESPPLLALVDLDGVLVDFVGAMAKALNVPYRPDQIRGEYDVGKIFGLKTDLFSLFGPDFWEACDWMRDGQAILQTVIRAVGEDHVWICSSPTHESSSPMGKLRWIEKHLDDRWARRYIFTPHKDLLAKPGTILVDDSDAVIDAFRKVGGQAVRVARPWNCEWPIAGQALDYLAEDLKRVNSENDRS
ncbi:adenylyltransferase/cytidyltransferase family protein [Candidatus Pacearchaeota archaeon]|jgi:rfaE bifunctional protein nucleotidyltransferase chain/domain|nr:adenylyltransferase/cytidyltransferase family protein [Candidatus Pacearchaeota archaeon]